MLNDAFESMFYADDGFLYFNNDNVNPIAALENIDPNSGIKAHITEPKSKWNKKENKWLTDVKFVGRRHEPKELHPENTSLKSTLNGIMANATRTPHDYKFKIAEVFADAIKYDQETKDTINKNTLISSFPKNDQWLYSKYFGFISSRLYLGTDKNDSVKQDFHLKWEEGSWCDFHISRNKPYTVLNRIWLYTSDGDQIYLPHKFKFHTKSNDDPINIFNVSSYAALSLSIYMKRNKLGKFNKKVNW